MSLILILIHSTSSLHKDHLSKIFLFIFYSVFYQKCCHYGFWNKLCRIFFLWCQFYAINSFILLQLRLFSIHLHLFLYHTLCCDSLISISIIYSSLIHHQLFFYFYQCPWPSNIIPFTRYCCSGDIWRVWWRSVVRCVKYDVFRHSWLFLNLPWSAAYGKLERGGGSETGEIIRMHLVWLWIQ